MDIHSFKPVKLFIAILYNKDADPENCITHLESVFSQTDHRSRIFLFDHTNYYQEEMGSPLSRVLLSFERLIRPESLAEIKHLSRVIEGMYSHSSKRNVNLDPGYLDLDKVVLASAKYGRQKIPLTDGIYADPTLEFTRHTFRPFEWTFPDFSTGLYNEDLKQIRLIYKHQLRALD